MVSLSSLEEIVIKLADEKPQQFSYEQLKSFTSDFNCKIGAGGFGDVYKGHFPNGVEVAVKVLKTSKTDIMETQFSAEVQTMGRTYHQNLIKLYGFCIDANMKALVYEFMKNGSLDMILFENHINVEWVKLYYIAIEIAKGLAYLHEYCSPQIIHNDVKASNVLLDSELSPKIIDFGLAKVRDRDLSSLIQSGFRGTSGYAAPEVDKGQLVTHKSDVYGFGMMLFEILSRKRNSEGPDWFPREIWKNYENQRLGEYITKCTGIGENDKEIAIQLSLVALLCSQYMPQDRPNMSTVVKMLEGEIQPWMPMNPFPYYECSTGRNSISGSIKPRSRGPTPSIISLSPSSGERSRQRWEMWRTKLKHDYFSSPWAIISFIAGFTLLVLTVVQTVIAVLSFRL